MIYSIDSSALIQGWNELYPPDSFPGIWRDLEDLISRGGLKASVEVRHELEKIDDGLLRWTQKQIGLFQPIDGDIQVAVREILAGHRNLVKAIKGRSGADPFVIALARIASGTVVTEEIGGSERKPRIPYVCQSWGVRCTNLLGLCREQRWKYGQP
ncbi:DUF4411 family protein [Elusimicrobiota bacterium]